MDADHSSICKFDEVSNPACQDILKTIKSELERALQLRCAAIDATDSNSEPRRISELEKQDQGKK